MVDFHINARDCWMGDEKACRHLYRVYREIHFGKFKQICKAYGWKPASMIKALRIGKR